MGFPSGTRWRKEAICLGCEEPGAFWEETGGGREGSSGLWLTSWVFLDGLPACEVPGGWAFGHLHHHHHPTTDPCGDALSPEPISLTSSAVAQRQREPVWFRSEDPEQKQAAASAPVPLALDGGMSFPVWQSRHRKAKGEA